MRHRDPLTDAQRAELDALDRALAGEAVDADLRDLEELVRDIRATAPQMAPGFAARLEHDVREGFPTPRERPIRPSLRERRPWTGWTRRRWALLPAAGSLAAVLVALVVVFGANNGDDGSAVTNDFGSIPTEAATPPGGGAADSGEGAGSGGAEDRASSSAPSVAPVQPAPAPGAVAPARVRRVERSAVLALRTPGERFERTTDAVIATVERFGGIVASSQIGASDAAGSEAFFDLRIPTERLDRALSALSRLGHVTERSQSLQDITASFHSAQERLTEARAERRGLLRALERATTENRIDRLRARLRAVSGRIAGLEGQLSSLRRRADLSRVDLTVRAGAESGAATGDAWTPGDAAADALRVLEVLAGVALVALAVLAPLALLGAVVVLAVRVSRRRRRESALDPA